MTEPVVRRGRGRPRDPQVERTILDAALELFLEKGMDATSIEQIAKRAGVAKLTLYRRWSSKEELLARAIEEMRSGLPDLDLLADAETPLPELLVRLVDQAAEFLTYPGVGVLLSRLIGARADHPALVEVYWRRFVEPRRELVLAVVEMGKQEGLLRADADAETTIDIIVGAVLHRLLLRPGTPTVPETRAFLVSVLEQVGVNFPGAGSSQV
jgi:AcrR family transcriptional regulator